MSPLLKRLREQRGAELIEMAMVTPILALILAGIVDFGFLFRSWEIVSNAAREGARVGVLPKYECDPSMPDDVESRVDRYMASAGFPDPTAYVVDINTGTVSTAAGDFTACAVTVRMFAQLPSLGVIGGMFGGTFTSVPVAGSAVMRSEVMAVPTP
jgi:Flp pilus assembly protein TadG